MPQENNPSLASSEWGGRKVHETIEFKTQLPEYSVPDEGDVNTNMRRTNDNNKRKSKEYTDKMRHAQPCSIKENDIVLVKQKRTNKLSTPFDPRPLKVTEVKGSMITAKRGRNHCACARGSTLFLGHPAKFASKLGLLHGNYMDPF